MTCQAGETKTHISGVLLVVRNNFRSRIVLLNMYKGVQRLLRGLRGQYVCPLLGDIFYVLISGVLMDTQRVFHR